MLLITPADRAVLQLLADGSPTIDIANRLGLSERAIDTMLTALLERMGAADPAEAVADAQRRGLLSIPARGTVGDAIVAGTRSSRSLITVPFRRSANASAERTSTRAAIQIEHQPEQFVRGARR